jgi:hypothetical protein
VLLIVLVRIVAVMVVVELVGVVSVLRFVILVFVALLTVLINAAALLMVVVVLVLLPVSYPSNVFLVIVFWHAQRHVQLLALSIALLTILQQRLVTITILTDARSGVPMLHAHQVRFVLQAVVLLALRFARLLVTRTIMDSVIMTVVLLVRLFVVLRVMLPVPSVLQV